MRCRTIPAAGQRRQNVQAIEISKIVVTDARRGRVVDAVALADQTAKTCKALGRRGNARDIDRPSQSARYSPEMGLGSFEGHRNVGGPRDPEIRSYLDRRFSRLRCGGRLRFI